MTDIQDIPDRNSQMETLLNQMNERLQQLEQENNEMRAQNLQYQHQIETRANEQALGSSRFRAEIRPMPLLETPAETVTNDVDTVRTPENNRTEPSQGEQIIPPINNMQNFAGTI